MKHFLKLTGISILSYLIIVIVVTARDGVFSVVGKPFHLVHGNVATVWGGVVYTVWGILLAVLTVWLVKRWVPFRIRFTLRDDVRWVALIPLVLAYGWVLFDQIVETFKSVGHESLSRNFGHLLNGILPGTFEEILIRGGLLAIVLYALHASGTRALKAAVISSLVFGSLHFINLTGGQSLEATIQQVIYAFIIGLSFAALYYRTGSIWPGIVLHILTDFTGDYGGSTAAMIPWHELAMYFGPLLLISLFMLRPSQDAYKDRKSVV